MDLMLDSYIEYKTDDLYMEKNTRKYVKWKNELLNWNEKTKNNKKQQTKWWSSNFFTNKKILKKTKTKRLLIYLFIDLQPATGWSSVTLYESFDAFTRSGFYEMTARQTMSWIAKIWCVCAFFFSSNFFALWSADWGIIYAQCTSVAMLPNIVNSKSVRHENLGQR